MVKFVGFFKFASKILAFKLYVRSERCYEFDLQGADAFSDIDNGFNIN